MKANQIEVVFTEDCEIFKKGGKHSFVKSIASALVNQEKVAKYSIKKEQEVKKSKTK
jgi:hypothetical protein